MRIRHGITALALVAATTIALSPTAGAQTVVVDPGTALSAGKVIIGTGQNLPSLDSTGSWNIGSYPASQVNAYYSSGAAAADQAEVAASALAWSKSWVKKVCGSSKPAKVRACKAAAVFDIDETLLSNYEWISSLPVPFTYDVAASNAANQNCTTPPIKATLALFNSFKSMGVTPFLVTGRDESQRQLTEACLAKAGITGYEALVLKPAGNTQSAAQRKADQRKALISQGWKIGPSVGDQISDMSNGSLTRGFLLPNAMYYLP